MSDELHAEDFGVIGDGSHDDTAAIQRLVDRFGVATTLEFLRGHTWYLSSPIKVPAGTVIQGETVVVRIVGQPEGGQDADS